MIIIRKCVPGHLLYNKREGWPDLTPIIWGWIVRYLKSRLNKKQLRPMTHETTTTFATDSNNYGFRHLKLQLHFRSYNKVTQQSRFRQNSQLRTIDISVHLTTVTRQNIFVYDFRGRTPRPL